MPRPRGTGRLSVAMLDTIAKAVMLREQLTNRSIAGRCNVTAASINQAIYRLRKAGRIPSPPPVPYPMKSHHGSQVI